MKASDYIIPIPILKNEYQNKFDLIKEILSNTILDKEVKTEAAKSIIEREKIMTTAVGNGIAIPHAKVEHINEPKIFLTFLKDGIDFDSIDEKLVHYIFLMVFPYENPGLRIKLLSRISRLMIDAYKKVKS